jgi:hypothetical protein
MCYLIREIAININERWQTEPQMDRPRDLPVRAADLRSAICLQIYIVHIGLGNLTPFTALSMISCLSAGGSETMPFSLSRRVEKKDIMVRSGNS